MTKRPTVALIVLAIAVGLLFVVGPPPGALSAFRAKSGRVIDKASGKGIPDAFVLATATFEASPLINQSTNKVLFNVVVRADADGAYRVPSQWEHLALSLPGTDARITWAVTAFSPGYVVVGDDDGWRFTGDVAPFAAKSASEPPPAHWTWDGMEVDPRVLERTNLTLEEATVYYRKILLAGVSSVEAQSTLETQLRAASNEYFKQLVCSKPSDTAIAMRIARYLMMFSTDQASAELRLQAIDPGRWSALSYARALPYSAAEVCDALRSGGAS